MDRIDAMKAFLAVVRYQGFAPAARALGLSTSAMSRHVQALESWLGVHLFRRTPRQISLTSEGERYLAQLRQIIGDIDALEAEARGTSLHPSGDVRITGPRYFTQRFLAAEFAAFHEAYPDVNVRLYLIDRVVNLVEEGFDLAIRIGHLDDSALIARRIGKMRVVVTAAPDYIEAHGRPTTVEDLKDHNCIVDLTPQHGNRWPFFEDKGCKSVEVSGRLFANDGEMVRRMTLAGQGISMLPDFFLAEDLRAGRLIPLLDDVRSEESGIFLFYVKERLRSSAVQALIDWFVNEFKLEQ